MLLPVIINDLNGALFAFFFHPSYAVLACKKVSNDQNC